MFTPHKALQLVSSLPFIALLGALATGAGCAATAHGSEAKQAQVTPADMPEGGEWQGVYYSPVFGYLHLMKDKNNAEGKWRTTDGGAWGELHGQVTGDLLRFTWVEHRIGQVGASATSNGEGYFRYVRTTDENGNDELKGEWGLGQSNTGNVWTALKQRLMNPEPESVVPDQTERVQGGGWDGAE